MSAAAERRSISGGSVRSDARAGGARPAQTGTWTESALRVLRERYLAKDASGAVVETPEDMCWRVATTIAAAERSWGTSEEGVAEIARAFYDMMVRRLFLPNSPTLMNAGRGTGLQYSACYVLPVGDSMEEIFDAVKAAAVIHQSGGGTGMAFSRLRQKNALVRSTGGRSSGPVSFLRVFNAATEAVKQGGARRGANMGILRVDHPDILEFIDAKRGGGIENFNVSVAVTDAFMDALAKDADYDLVAPHTGEVTGRLSARTVWNRIAEAAWSTGDPGVIFIDRINASPANPTPELGLIEATNPCIASDALVYTADGLRTFGALAAHDELPHLVVDSRFERGERALATALFARGRRPVFRLSTFEGHEIRLTSDHRVLTTRGFVRASDLAEGDELCLFSGRGGFGSAGTWEEGQALGKDAVTDAASRERGVPTSVLAGSMQLQRGFLQAVFAVAGDASPDPEEGASVRLTAASLPLLRDVQRMLLGFEIATRIRTSGPLAGEARLPDDRSAPLGGDHPQAHELVVARESLVDFAERIGFSTEAKTNELRALLSSRPSAPRRERFTARFRALEPDGEDEVFDVVEPLTRSFVANGFIVHNCGEQPLLPNDACNLGSINVSALATQSADGAWDLDWVELERIVRLAVRFLDDVIEVNPYPLPEIDRVVKQNRRIGLGVMGWADLLFRLGVPYDSEEALALAERLMRAIQKTGHDESARLADSRGAFPSFPRSIYKNGRPLRNSTVTTIAPTGTISMIAGCSSGIEPVFALAFTHTVGERTLTFVDPVFLDVVRERGLLSDDLVSAVARTGTLRGVDTDLPEDIRRVFVTAREIAPAWHVRHQAAFQKHTDNGVSKTINLPEDATVDDVRSAYDLAWQLGCLGITVFREGSKEGVLRPGIAPAPKPSQPSTVAVEPAKTHAPVASTRVLEPRPPSLPGRTHRVETPLGTAFVVVNEDAAGEPFEVFVSVGKAGSDTMAVAEAIGRLVSFALRIPSPISREQRLREIVEQLSGIGGSRPLGFGAARVLSLPDGIARALARHLGSHASSPGDLCPECGNFSLAREEGCTRCLVCGFSEC